MKPLISPRDDSASSREVSRGKGERRGGKVALDRRGMMGRRGNEGGGGRRKKGERGGSGKERGIRGRGNRKCKGKLFSF